VTSGLVYLDRVSSGRPDDGTDGGRPSGRNAVLAAANQGINGLGSFALTVGVARVGDVETVGHFALAYLTLQFAQITTRAGLSQEFMVHRATDGVDGLASDRDLIRSSAWVGLVGAAVAGAITLATLRGEPRSIALLLTAAFPVMAVVDCLRFVAIARGVPGQAVAQDSVRVVGFVLVMAGWTVVGRPTVLGAILVWIVMATLGMAMALISLRLRLYVPAIRAWWKARGRMALAYSSESLVNRAALYSVSYSLVWFASISAVAGFRAGSALTNLITICFAAVPMVVMPHYRARLTRSTGVVSRVYLLRIAAMGTGYVVLLTALGSVVLLNVPADIGRQILGDVWPLARESLPGLLFQTAGGSAVVGPTMVLRATARVRHSLVSSLVMAVCVMIGGMTGAALGGAPGAGWGLGFGGWVGVAFWFWVIWADGDWDPRSDRVTSRLAAAG